MIKKAVIDIGPMQLGGVILAIIIIVGTIVFFARLSGIFTGGGVERATEVSFDTMIAKLNQLIQDESVCSATPDGQNFFVGDEYAVVGFNKGIPLKKNGCVEENVARPLRPDCPSDQVCICLYKTQKTFNDKQPIKCQALNADYIFMQKYDGKERDASIIHNMASGDGGELVPTWSILVPSYYPAIASVFIFGSCNKNWGSEPSFGTKRVYLEKRQSKEQKILLIKNYDVKADELYEKCAKEPLQLEKVL